MWYCHMWYCSMWNCHMWIFQLQLWITCDIATCDILPHVNVPTSLVNHMWYCHMWYCCMWYCCMWYCCMWYCCMWCCHMWMFQLHVLITCGIATCKTIQLCFSSAFQAARTAQCACGPLVSSVASPLFVFTSKVSGRYALTSHLRVFSPVAEIKKWYWLTWDKMTFRCCYLLRGPQFWRYVGVLLYSVLSGLFCLESTQRFPIVVR